MDTPPPDDAGTDVVDFWLGLIAALVSGGAALALAAPAYGSPEPVTALGVLSMAAGIGLLLATPLAAAWATRRQDWQGAGLRAVGVGIVAAVAAVPLVRGLAGLAGLAAAVPPVPVMVTAGVGAAVAAAGRATSPWSLAARGVAVAGVLLAPLGVLAAGDLLGPHPSAVARSMWFAAMLGVLPVTGVADLVAHALARRPADPGA